MKRRKHGRNRVAPANRGATPEHVFGPRKAARKARRAVR